MQASSNGRHEPAVEPTPAEREYGVRALSVAAALRCAGAPYLRTALSADNWGVFIFDNAAGDVPRMVARYWAGTLPPVQARDLAAALIGLRTELRELKAAAKAAPAVEGAGGGR